MNTLCVFRPGTVDYDAALAAQEACVARLKACWAPPSEGFLLLVGHPPVITIGRGGDEGNILADVGDLARRGVAVRRVSRGGDVTFHGPGQVVGYPIVRLEGVRRDVHAFLRSLEQVILDALADFGVAGRRRKGYTGVWVGDEKIAAIGVAITRWVTYHGFALNVTGGLDPFSLIHPCGIRGCRVTTMARVLGSEVDRRRVEDRLAVRFAERFGFDDIREEAGLPPMNWLGPPCDGRALRGTEARAGAGRRGQTGYDGTRE